MTTLLLTRRDVADLLSLDDCIEAVEDAFRLLGRGEVPRPAIAGVHATGGGFHIKAAIAGERFAAKINSNFFTAVPRIKGVIVVADACASWTEELHQASLRVMHGVFSRVQTLDQVLERIRSGRPAVAAT